MSKYKSDGSVIIDVEADLSKFNASLSKISKAGTVALGAIGVSAGLLVKQVVDVGVGFESAFAGVKKTVNASAQELEGFRKEILNLSTDIPQTANEIANIAEAAGQLGIKNDALMGFTRTMADLGVATNMGATEAATTLARFANITQMSQKDFDRLGSTIVELGNNLATTEAEIADMALNIAGAGHQVGMTEPQILALSAALSSVGIEAAAGGTAMSTLMIEIKKSMISGGKDLEKFANVANMSAKDFKESFEKDAGKAIQTFIEGLGSASERGVDAIALLNNAGLTDVRMTRALLNAANASDVFSGAFELANTAWDENIALTKEAEQRYETTESKMQILNNTIAKAGITAFEKFKEPFKAALDTGIDSVNELTSSLENGRLGQSVDNVAKSFSDLVSTIIKVGTKALPPLIDGLAWIMDNGDMVVAGIIAYNIATKGTLIVAKVAKGIKELNSLMAFQATVTGKAGASLVAFTAKTKIAQFATANFAGGLTSLYAITGGIAVAGIVALTVGCINYTKKLDNTNNMISKNNRKMKELRETMKSIQEQSEENFKTQSLEITNSELYAEKISRLVDENGNLTGSKDVLIEAIDRFNQSVGESFYYYDEETGKLMTQKGEVANLSDSIKNLIALKYANAYIDTGMEAYTEATKEQSEITDQNRIALDKYNEAKDKYSDYDLTAMNEFYQKIKDGKVGVQELGDTLKNFGIDDTTFMKIMSEVNGPLETMLSNSKEFSRLEDEIVKPFEAVQTAIANNDSDKLNNFKLGLDVTEEGTSLDNYNTKIVELKDKIKDMDQLKELGIKFNQEEYYATKKQLEELELAKLKIFSTDIGVFETELTNTEDNYLNPLRGKVQTKLGDIDGDYLEHGTTSGNNFKDRVVPVVDGISFKPKYVDIYFNVHYPEGLSSANGAFGGASYDDTQDPYPIIQPIIQPNYSRMVDMAKSLVGGIQNRVARNVSLGNTKIQFETGKGNSTQISQEINFNQPVEKASQVTRAIEKASRDLKKAK